MPTKSKRERVVQSQTRVESDVDRVVRAVLAVPRGVDPEALLPLRVVRAWLRERRAER